MQLVIHVLITMRGVIIPDVFYRKKSPQKNAYHWLIDESKTHINSMQNIRQWQIRCPVCGIRNVHLCMCMVKSHSLETYSLQTLCYFTWEVPPVNLIIKMYTTLNNSKCIHSFIQKQMSWSLEKPQQPFDDFKTLSKIYIRNKKRSDELNMSHFIVRKATVGCLVLFTKRSI